MKRFNQVITVEVSVQSIADKLLVNVNPEFKHAEMLVETIIGSANNQALGMIYNSLNGFTNDINFKVNDIVYPRNLSDYSYRAKEEGEGMTDDYIKIQSAKIVEIDLYKHDKLNIEYTIINSKGIETNKQKWINHSDCQIIEVNEEDQYAPVQ